MATSNSKSNSIKLSFPEPDIALLAFDLPDKGANILSRSVLEEFYEHLSSLEKKSGLAGLVITSGKPGTFIAGADLREFAAALNTAQSPAALREQTVAICTQGQSLFGLLANRPYVTVAAIDGICVGGGAELAVWCDRRVLSDSEKTQYGFPEVKLGLMPGWGGTARLPRLVGLANAVEMITSGESIDPRAAGLMGLAVDVVPAADLVAAAVRVVRAEQKSGQWLEDRRRWSGPIDMSETEIGFLGATASGYIQQVTHGHYPAPLSALEVMLGAAGGDVDAALKMEADAMADLFGSPVNRALINVFFLTDRNKRDTGLPAGAASPKDVGSVGVVGAGIMGQGIAAANVRRRIPATITDASPDALRVGVEQILREVSYDKAIKGPDAKRAFEYGPLLTPTSSDAEVARASLVIEAIVERLDAKRQLYARLEPLMAPDAVLASNTSTIPITQLAEGLKHPERFVGLHFFNPVRRMPLVEVIRGEKTSDQTVSTMVAYAKRLGKSPIVVNDGPGFLVNRLLLPYMHEAVELLVEGVPVKAIDRAAKTFGMPMGPLELYDVVGLDTAMHAGAVMHFAFPDRVGDSPLLRGLVAAGRLGQKSGSGFYSYRNKKKRAEPDPTLDEFLRPLVRGTAKLSGEQLADRMFLPMLLEATRILAEGIVRDPRDVDLGLIFGTGFPPFRGGLLFWADTLGAGEILKRLGPYESLGARYQPTEMLIKMAQEGRKFYD